jgi:tetratricopeptide (TPR) repeat protein
MDNAKAAYETAAANGQQEIANKQLANICLREASNALKNKNYSAAVAAALKVNEYGENPQAYQIAGQASQLAGKNNDAIGFFEKYLQIAPKSSNAGQIAYTVGVLYQQAKNNDKAKEFYTKALSDPKFGASAKKLIDALK